MRLARLILTWGVAAAVAAGTAVSAGGAVSRRDAESLRRKVSLINQRAVRPAKQPLRTPVTEDEVNAYLVFDADNQIPEGVVEPAVSILGGGRLAGRAVVDLDAVRRARSRGGLFDPMNYLTGRLPIAATGILRTQDGVGQFQLESAEIASISVPKRVLQEVVSYYSRTPENPQGIDLEAPFELPARIREIEVGRGQAIVVQ